VSILIVPLAVEELPALSVAVAVKIGSIRGCSEVVPAPLMSRLARPESGIEADAVAVTGPVNKPNHLDPSGVGIESVQRLRGTTVQHHRSRAMVEVSP